MKSLSPGILGSYLFAIDSSTVRPQPQIVPLNREDLNGCGTTTFSSLLISLLPNVSSSLNEQSPKRSPQPVITSSRIQPNISGTWRESREANAYADRSLYCSLKDESEYDSEEKLNTDEEKGQEPFTKLEATSNPCNLTTFQPDIMEESSFLSPDMLEFLQSSVPNIVRGCRWVLLYSTLKHGISLRTLLRNSANLPGPCILVAGDMQGAVFGGLLNSPLKPTTKRKYQGNSETFVFTTIYGNPRLFRATGANRYYYMCMNDLLAFGGGGNFALRLDGDLLQGTSGPCETFGNLCLARSKEFELKHVELWGFTHSMRYHPQ
ncbi:oxidation resistance protein 1 isoform X2 [Amborella trichopoda]|uniref:oxidation resistance protein 1 isoform X2 n=1 Tax=Amborella trichopoda TaxID=13333 RepID=UPI0009BE0CE1|nr:oxidation resistance protein 1 isoform X2 [Amborella trichopoda]|eukprot:XP_020529152.1 oxidation resistance protein 1 isoform X2 [Amborella trichopoda]